ncbi:MAG: GNAT family N-acetyltransferase, partial [Thermomicrobiales bacterium]
ARFRGDATITIKTIVSEGRVAGYVLKHEQFGQPEVSYWLGKDYWGKGLATQALSAFLGYAKEHPLYAQAAGDNFASIRVLEKCGFVACGTDREFSNARAEEVEEVVLKLQ